MKRSLTFVCALLAACGPSGDDDTSVPCNANLVAGDLVITEVFADAEGADEGKEWFEIFNTTAAAIELEGVVVYASKTSGADEVSHVMRTHIIEAGGYAVIGGVADEFRPPYVDYGYGDDLRVGSSRGLPNADGKLSLECGGVLVDDMTWSVMTSGASKALDGTRSPDYQENDDLQFWCDSTTEFELGALGTPGATNDACSTVAPTMCDDGGTSRPVVAPEVGDLVITEVFAAPTTTGNGGPGSDGEWFEVEVRNKDLDLNGLQLGQAEVDTGPKSVSTTLNSVACLRVTQGTRLVFAASSDSSLNGGLPAVDHVITFGLTNSDDGVFVGWGDAPLDVVTWTSSRTGISRSLDAGSIDATTNDEDRFWCAGVGTYGTQNQVGTPGAENGLCDIAPPDGMCFLPGGGMRAIDKPTSGEIIVNEWMARPTVNDSDGEWIELQALAGFDLNGLELGQAEPPTHATPGPKSVAQTLLSPDCLPVTAGQFVLLVRNANDMVANGGLDPAMIDFTLGFGLTNSDDGVFIGIDGTTLDMQTWPPTINVAAYSTQLDPSTPGQTCSPSSAATYGTGGRGTPKSVNVCCTPGTDCPGD